MTNDEAFDFVRCKLLEGIHPHDVIDDLHVRGFSFLEAEELVEQAQFNLKNDGDS